MLIEKMMELTDTMITRNVNIICLQRIKCVNKKTREIDNTECSL